MGRLFFSAFMRVFVLLVILLFLSGAGNSVQAAKSSDLTVALNTLNFSIDSTAYLSITITGAGSAEIDLPEVENLIFHRKEQRSTTQVINSSITSSITYVYALRALKTGIYTIPPFKVKTGNGTLVSEPLSFEVSGTASKAGTAAGPEKDHSKNFFVIVQDLPEKAYVGEILPVRIRAFFRQGIRAEIQRIPEISGDGFVLNPPSGEAQQTLETHNGRNYSVITWLSSLSPIKEGEYNFRVGLDATLLVPQKNGRSPFSRHPFFSSDPFADDFFDDFFGSIKREEVHLQSPEKPVIILPLPQQGRPRDFSGAVGDFDFDLQASPLKIGVGDPITLTMTIAGKGNFDRVSAPQFPESSKWKTYSPTSRFEDDGSSYQGKKIFEQAIVAKSADAKTIPALRFSYFDPRKEEYVTRTIEALPVTVTAADTAQAAAPAIAPLKPAGKPAQKATAPPAVQVRLETGQFVTEIAPVYKRGWFIATLMLCTFALLAVLTLALLKRYRIGNSELLHKKRIRTLLAKELQALRRDLESENENAFVERCRRIIQEHLAISWKMQPSAITLDDLQKRLPADSPLILLFTATVEHTYGGLHLSAGEMRRYCQMLEKELGEVTS